METQEILDVLTDCGALLEGHFELRSGLHSNRFFQCANVLRYPRHAQRLCEELIGRTRRVDPGALAAEAVISPALGGILVGHELARALDLPSIFAEKQDGKLVMRRFAITAGMRYLIGEDVVTRGGRVQETIDLVRAGGGLVTGVLLLVDRSADQAHFDCPTHSLLQMAPVVYAPASCPLCREGVPCVHPGS